MAAQIGTGKDFKFRNVQIFKSQSLGHGSYGAVYKAKCDQLPCAAKLLHQVLVNPRQRRNVYRFEQECQFLSGIRHPHIIQYLGTCRDPESHFPILLMELMDESLTHFLEESQERLPYHLEINLCHDVALALAYLHSNGIIHRDLSSNNVLLIAGSRAKVTDFGMSKLLDAVPPTTPLTQCPGTSAYMSPEAFKVPPVYTSKLDCFSHGVLGIQVMTRKFPDPGPALQEIEDPRSPVGMIKIPIPETERRKSHISHIHPNHPLLLIAIQCLSYNEKDRPTSQELCHQLATLKEAPHYIKNMQQERERERREQSFSAEATDGRITQLQRNVYKLQKQIQENQQQLHEKDVVAVTSQQEIQRLTHDNQQLTQDNQRLTQDNQRINRNNQQLTHDNQRLTRDNQQLTRDTLQLRHELEQTIPSKQRLSQENQQLRHELEQAIQDNQRLSQEIQRLTQDSKKLRHELDQTALDNQQLRRKVREKDKQIECWERQMQDNEHIIAEFQQTLVQKEKRIGDLEETESAREGVIQEQPKPKPPPQPLPSQPKTKPPSPPPHPKPPPLPPKPKPREQQKKSEPSNTTVDTIKLNWRQCPKAPHEMRRGSATVDGSMTYFSSQLSSTVHAYNSDKEVWSQLPECPRYSFTLVIVKGVLTAVGGKQSDKPSNTLLSLTWEGSKRKWCKHFPPMPSKRYLTAVVCSGKLLVVAGGEEDYTTILRTVEVMDTESLQWFTASSLPHPLTETSATICGENLYLLGGLDQCVFTCSLSALLESCQQQSLGANPKTSSSLAQEPTIWHKVASVPVYRSTCTTLCGQLLAIGGCDSDLNPTIAIHKYSQAKNTWTIISCLPTPRHESLVAVLPGDKLMVVGGGTRTHTFIGSDVVEIAVL